MDRKLRKTLTECIRDIETGARDVEGCLRRHPDQAAELRPHLELWSRLEAASKAQPNFGNQQRGRHRLLAVLEDMDSAPGKRVLPFLTPAVAKAAAVIGAVALLVGGAAGASAALGGPDFTDDVLTTVGIASSHDNGRAADTLETVDEEKTPSQADFGLETARGAVEDPLQNIARQHAAAAAEDGLNKAESAQADGLSNAEEARDGAPGRANGDRGSSGDHSRNGGPPDSVPAGPPE